jgi:thioredoxin reductase
MRIVDPTAIDGKFSRPREHYDVAVVGAGAAGCAEAIAAARAGARVLLVDENPLPPGLIGLDVPLRFGGRATPAVQKPERMMEQILAAEPLLAEAFEAEVDVRLGVCVWGAWAPGPATRALPCPLLGLSDDATSWFVGFDRLVVAAGARDLSLGFPGADLPGVVGAQGFHSLLTRYEAFSGQRIVVLGNGALAADTEALARSRGLEVERTTDLPLRTTGGADGVEAVTLLGPDGTQRILACDTVCLAIGLVPNVELPAVLDCDLTFDAARGGWVPVLDDHGRTSLPFVRVVGDAACVAADDRMDWMRRLLAQGDATLCLCEEVTRADFSSVHPPRYLGASSEGQAKLDALGTHPDHAKRLTRAGMGACQGRRCREQIAMLLALEAGIDLGKVPLASYRIPLRPLPMAALAAAEEVPAMAQDWPIWFGIDTQWTHWENIPVVTP